MTENCSFQCNLKQPLVLVVDDDEDNLELLAQLLQFVECSFVTAEDGVTAITLAQQHYPDLILLDMILPDLSGVEVAQSLQQNPQTKNIPIVAVTATARAESQQQFLESGCLECVIKPYCVDKLVEIIDGYLFQKK